MAKDLIWSARPILSLIKQFNYEGSGDKEKLLHHIENGSTVTEVDPAAVGAVWHGPVTQTFSDTATSNVLKLQVRFKAKDPYGCMAKYMIWIDRFVEGSGGIPWQREVWDPVCFCTPRGDHDTWYYYEREYTLSQDISVSKITAKKDTELKFKITGYVWIGGSLPTNGGSSGHWGEPHFKEFTAVLKPPKMRLVKEQLVDIQRRQEYYARQFIEHL